MAEETIVTPPAESPEVLFEKVKKELEPKPLSVVTFLLTLALGATVHELILDVTTRKPAAVVPASAGATALSFDKNTSCDQECKRLGYVFGAYGKQACHCWNEL